MAGLGFYVIWQQCISRSCPELVLSIIIFLPLKKRLMSPENSTRKVNTILKCQEINDIVLSSYGPVEEGDKCLALFTPFLPICDLFLSPSHCLCLFVCFSFILHLPSFVSSLFSFTGHGLQDLFALLCINDVVIFSNTTQEMVVLYTCAVVSKWKRWGISIMTQWDFNTRS